MFAEFNLFVEQPTMKHIQLLTVFLTVLLLGEILYFVFQQTQKIVNNFSKSGPVFTEALNQFLRPSPCPADTQWYDGCNVCTCSRVLHEDDVCTAVQCPRDHNKWCTPGKAYFDGHRWCFCHSDPSKDVCKILNL